MGELSYARKSIAREEAFENGLQACWEEQIGGLVKDRCEAKQQEIEALEEELERLVEQHKIERLSKQTTIARAQRRIEEMRKESVENMEKVNARLAEAKTDITHIAATRKRLRESIANEMRRLELEAKLTEEVNKVEEQWRMRQEDVVIPFDRLNSEESPQVSVRQ